MTYFKLYCQLCGFSKTINSNRAEANRIIQEHIKEKGHKEEEFRLVNTYNGVVINEK